MTNNVYVVDLLADDTEITDTDGIDWLVINGAYAEPTSIRLDWYVENGVSSQARGFFYYNGLNGHSVLIHGAIENARGGNGRDWIQGNELNNLLYGDVSASGPGGSDTLYGGYGLDTIYGGSGNDEISGAYDADLLYGGDGRDTLYGGSGNDTIQGGAGADLMTGGADGQDWVSYSGSAAGVTVRIMNGEQTTGQGGDAQGDTLGGFNNVMGSANADVIIDMNPGNVAFGYNANIFRGGAGGDFLNVNGGNDTAYGETGNDTVNGGAGNDLLYGGTGNDSLHGGADSDRLYGEAGNDAIYGGAAADLVYGGADNDQIFGGGGRDTLRGDAGHDRITATGPVGASFDGGAGNDTLIGGAGNDSQWGSDGNDQLLGGNGNDNLRGGGGADLLRGGAGADSLFGGAAADTFQFVTTTESPAATHDRIFDFSRADGDRIALGLIDARTDIAGNQAFSFIGAATFTGVAGQLRVQDFGNLQRILADVNGDRVADLVIDVVGTAVPGLIATDFSL